MEKHKDDEHLDDHEMQDAAASNEFVSASQNEITSQTQAAPNMEVHHHAHSHGKKNWKSYIWEFLMLFFAVFCGFLAEYQLEHSIEHDREKQYIGSMVADMMEDSAKISASIAFCTKQYAGFDSILQNIYHRPYTDSSLKKLYMLQFTYTNSRNPVIFTKRTITQLKNSGGLRLIKNAAASDTIISYSESCERAELQGEHFGIVRMDKVNEYAIKLFDNQYIINDKGTYNELLFDSNTPIPLLNSNEQMLREYANTLTYGRGSLKLYTRMLTLIQERIPFKIKFLKEEYKLK